MSYLKDKKRVVVKVGTSTLTHRTGRLNIRRVEGLVKNLADLQNAGHEIILVSSGAIGLGMSKIGLVERPKDTPTKQACAAVGQCELMYLYDKLFAEYSINVAQLLLTKFVLLEDRRQNVQNALERVIQLGAIPIVNENDTVAIDELELEVGENDSLAATVAKIANADLLIIMSDIDGLYDADPRLDPDAKLIPVVEELTDDIRKLAGGAGTKMGTGGMITKINAAEIAVNNGIDMIILNGKNPDNLYYLFETGSLGTRFKAKGSPAEKKEPVIDESSDSDIVEDQ
ncbi:MAG: glutamate 5-kinase [Ruminococcus albus]|jgi:glutamate 5-kinase|nr:glutamate 5-kinase [Ruminococcus albus]